MSRVLHDPDHRVTSLQALLQASRELGPELEEGLIASHLAQHPEVEHDIKPMARSVSETFFQPRFVPAMLLAANIGLGAFIEHLLVNTTGAWVGGLWLPQAPGLGAALTLLMTVNFAIAGALLLSLVALRTAGVDVWHRTRHARRIVGMMAGSAFALACFDGYWSVTGNGGWTPGTNIATTMVVGALIALFLAMAPAIFRALQITAHVLAEGFTKEARQRGTARLERKSQ